jgi:hypothetical protein
MINFSKLDFSNLPNRLGSVLALLIFILCLAFPIRIAYIIYLKNNGQIDKEIYDKKYGTISEGFRERGSKWVEYWPIIQILK